MAAPPGHAPSPPESNTAVTLSLKLRTPSHSLPPFAISPHQPTISTHTTFYPLFRSLRYLEAVNLVAPFPLIFLSPSPILSRALPVRRIEPNQEVARQGCRSKESCLDVSHLIILARLHGRRKRRDCHKARPSIRQFATPSVARHAFPTPMSSPTSILWNPLIQVISTVPLVLHLLPPQPLSDLSILPKRTPTPRLLKTRTHLAMMLGSRSMRLVALVCRRRV